MSTNPVTQSSFPADWGQLYSLAYGEVCVILESIFEQTITIPEAHANFLYHVEQHAHRREVILIEVRKAWAEIKDSARQE